MSRVIAFHQPHTFGQLIDRIWAFKSLLSNKASLCGPAFIASVAYVDPGNFAANITGGAQCGNSLLWVLLWGNVIALLVQTLACRLGIFTGQCLAENCGKHLPLFVKIPLWITSEVMSIATDLAEVLGAGIGITLVFHTPLFQSCLLGGLLSFLPFLKTSGEQKFLEKLMLGTVVAIGCAFGYELIVVKPDWISVAHGTLLPRLNSGNLIVAASMLGATVMPHVVFLHSGLMNQANQEATATKDERYKLAIADNFVALNFAWLINSAMVITFASAFALDRSGAINPTIESASQVLTPLFGNLASVVFGAALILSGLSSTTVGSMAGQIIMDGFWNIKIPLWARRALTLAPCLLIIHTGFDSTKMLVFSQVALSISLPFTIIPLIWLNASTKVMGKRRLSGKMLYAAWLSAGLVVSLNLALLINVLRSRYLSDFKI